MAALRPAAAAARSRAGARPATARAGGAGLRTPLRRIDGDRDRRQRSRAPDGRHASSGATTCASSSCASARTASVLTADNPLRDRRRPHRPPARAGAIACAASCRCRSRCSTRCRATPRSAGWCSTRARGVVMVVPPGGVVGTPRVTLQEGMTRIVIPVDEPAECSVVGRARAALPPALRRLLHRRAARTRCATVWLRGHALAAVGERHGARGRALGRRAAASGCERDAQARRVTLEIARATAAEAGTRSRPRGRRGRAALRVVVLDPGHGGADAGVTVGGADGEATDAGARAAAEDRNRAPAARAGDPDARRRSRDLTRGSARRWPRIARAPTSCSRSTSTRCPGSRRSRCERVLRAGRRARHRRCARRRGLGARSRCCRGATSPRATRWRAARWPRRCSPRSSCTGSARHGCASISPMPLARRQRPGSAAGMRDAHFGSGPRAARDRRCARGRSPTAITDGLEAYQRNE